MTTASAPASSMRSLTRSRPIAGKQRRPGARRPAAVPLDRPARPPALQLRPTTAQPIGAGRLPRHPRGPRSSRRAPPRPPAPATAHSARRSRAARRTSAQPAPRGNQRCKQFGERRAPNGGICREPRHHYRHLSLISRWRADTIPLFVRCLSSARGWRSCSSSLAVLGRGLGAAPARPRAPWPGSADYDVLAFNDPFKNGIERARPSASSTPRPKRSSASPPTTPSGRTICRACAAPTCVDRRGDGAIVEITPDLPLAGRHDAVPARYTTRSSPATSTACASPCAGRLKQYLGSMYIEPWTRHDKTRRHLRAGRRARHPGAQERHQQLVRRSARGFVHALRQRINELHRLGYLHPLPAAGPPADSPCSSPHDAHASVGQAAPPAALGSRRRRRPVTSRAARARPGTRASRPRRRDTARPLP